MLRLSLELAGGFEVVGQAGDTVATLALAKAVRPDVVLVDLRMPGRDGIELLRELRAADPSVGVVVLTGWLVEEDRERALAHGASAYLVKAPSLMATLVPALRAAARPRVGVDAER
jgi:DNA-binding NarL/FixJ family response regulator